VLFRSQEQVDKIVSEGHLIDGERLYAVLDMRGFGTGFLGLTSKRLLFLDKSFAGKHKAVVSVPYRMVTAVGSEDAGGWMQRKTSRLTVKAGNDVYEFQFWGDKAHAGYKILMREILQNEPR